MTSLHQTLDFRPGRLWSLWDMLEFDAYKFVGLMNSLRSITFMRHQATPELLAADTALSREAMGRMLQEHADHLAEMRLPTSKAAILDLKSSIVSYGPYNDLADTKVGFACRILRMETEGRKFLQIDDEDLYRKGASLFGPDVAIKFPTDGAFEIDEAGKCLAVGRSTACVFHLMRVLEIGVKATSTCLGIPNPVKDAERNWGVMLRKIKDEMERRNKAAPPQWSVAGDRDFFAEIYVSLDAVRNVWRNATMHVENKYIPEEAEHILAAVRGFMRKLASRLDERGQPLA
jgi:hypothetical protein